MTYSPTRARVRDTRGDATASARELRGIATARVAAFVTAEVMIVLGRVPSAEWLEVNAAVTSAIAPALRRMT